MVQDSISSALSVGHGYARVGGVRLHYAHFGSGERLVILLHGFPECWYSWRRQLTALGDAYTVVAPDMRGYNLSDKPVHVKDYRMQRLCDDVIGLVDYFGKKPAAIVGHDWGAAVAWEVALSYPEYVWKLVTMQVPPNAAWRANMTWRQALKSWYMLFFQLSSLPEWLIRRRDFVAIERMFRNTLARVESVSEEDIAVYKKALSVPGALTGALSYYRANLNSLWRPNPRPGPRIPRQIHAPTLFIYGERDFAIIPATVKGVEAFVDGPYRELRIRDSGHWVQQEAAAEVTRELRNFLNAA